MRQSPKFERIGEFLVQYMEKQRKKDKREQKRTEKDFLKRGRNIVGSEVAIDLLRLHCIYHDVPEEVGICDLEGLFHVGTGGLNRDRKRGDSEGRKPRDGGQTWKEYMKEDGVAPKVERLNDMIALQHTLSNQIFGCSVPMHPIWEVCLLDAQNAKNQGRDRIDERVDQALKNMVRVVNEAPRPKLAAEYLASKLEAYARRLREAVH